MKRVLHICGGPLDYGGISSWLLNYAARLDPNRVRVDFAVYGMEPGPREIDATRLGATVHHLPYKRLDRLSSHRALRTILTTGGYPIVHAHLDGMNGYVLALARSAGVPVRIAHCHNTDYLTRHPLRRMLHAATSRLTPLVATHLCACSEAAARFFYGERLVRAGRTRVIEDAIELDRCRFDSLTRSAIRSELNIADDTFVVGHVGRFDYQKNHAFLLQVFQALKAVRPGAILLLAGDGALRDDIEAQVRRLGLQDSVRLLGYRPDVAKIYSAFDVFVLPSRFEGLAFALVEAQAAGLPCVVSSAVPSDAGVADCAFLELDLRRWVGALAACEPRDRRAGSPPGLLARFDITAEAARLTEFYESLPA